MQVEMDPCLLICYCFISLACRHVIVLLSAKGQHEDDTGKCFKMVWLLSAESIAQIEAGKSVKWWCLRPSGSGKSTRLSRLAHSEPVQQGGEINADGNG